MKTFSHTAASIEVSAIKRIELLAKSKVGVISLAQGTPSFNTPENIKEAAKKAIDDNLAGKYTSGYGITELRNALAKKITRKNHISIDSSEVFVTHGGIEALMSAFLAILNPQETIIVLTPDYASHLTQIMIATHGTPPICVPLKEMKNDWVLDPKMIEQAITPHVKGILICNPCNPTGKVYSHEELKSIAAIAKKHDLYIFTDEMYEDFVYDGKSHISIGSFPEFKDQTISVFGVSKSYAMTGWRIGYITARKQILDEIFKIHDSTITCPTAVSQYAALEAITGSQDAVLEFKKAFLKRREMVMTAISKTEKLSLIKPQGSYFAFVKVNKPINDETFAVELIENAKVAVVPGSAFGKGGENHLRLSFGGDEQELKEGLQRFVDYIDKTL